jgi:hypothetical protein
MMGDAASGQKVCAVSQILELGKGRASMELIQYVPQRVR